MAKPEVLSRVDADLERGDIRLATQRLAGLLAADPQDLELRSRLADVYRGAGNAAEAGRWGFLTEGAEPHEIEAFARKHRLARDRLRLLLLRGENPRGLGPLAEPRYADLAALAAAEVRPGVLRPEAGFPAVEQAAPAPVVPSSSRSGRLDADVLNVLMLFGFVAVAIGIFIYEVIVAIYHAVTP
ncbi:DUF6584 family protein [Actinoplanes sp. NPDC049802]|uniref:DUF6584 family protein n=1 Tax=Actinoplanes sp. NPDC049802 TaxID=3154742 RepID=UPI0033D39AF8